MMQALTGKKSFFFFFDEKERKYGVLITKTG